MGTDRDRIEAHLPLRPVEFHILLSLAAGDRHGYGIIQDIQERGDAPPDVGTMYRALARMVDAGLAPRRPAPEGSEVMTGDRLVDASERWFRLLQWLYPLDFRDDMGEAVVETYRDRARDALRRGGILSLAILWMRALVDSLRNGPSERARPAASWRRGGNWGRDVELVS